MKSLTATYTCPHCVTSIDVKFIPSRHAPVCSNPSSPAYSDSGDPAELDGDYQNCPHCKAELDEDEILEHVEQNCEYPIEPDFCEPENLNQER